jgi:hypothetical protein
MPYLFRLFKYSKLNDVASNDVETLEVVIISRWGIYPAVLI